MVHVPTSVLLPYKQRSINLKLLLWLWFVTQYLDLVSKFVVIFCYCNGQKMIILNYYRYG